MVVKLHNRTVADGGFADEVQALTQASTGTAIARHGVTTITSAGSGTAGNHGFILKSPEKGLRKTIVADLNSTRTVTIYNQSTAHTFFGSTANSLAFSTGTGLKWVNLVGTSTSVWAVTSASTGVTIAASTVS